MTVTRELKVLIPVYIFVTLLISSCKTAQYQPELVAYEKKVGDISIELTLLNDEQLRRLHGKAGNPYIDYPGKIPRKQFIVFDANITCIDTVLNLQLRDISLELDTAVSENAESIDSLAFKWQVYMDDDNNAASIKRILNNTISKKNIYIDSKHPFEGYIVFLINTKNSENGVIQIPLSTDQGDSGIVEIPIKLKQEQSEENEKSGENTGIFAQ